MKKRVDVLLFEKELAPSREKAKQFVMAGIVYTSDRKILKSSELVEEDIELFVKEIKQYVSRGAYKLEEALKVFKISLDGLVCVDIGSSTGGFTDIMLRAKAKKVYAIDVGTNQLDYKLRIEPKVVVMEKTNFRTFDHSIIEEEIEFGATDVSFISLMHIFPNAAKILKSGSLFVTLIKPQFELTPNDVVKGLVKDKSKYQVAIDSVKGYAKENGFKFLDCIESPIKGNKKGNTEFLALFKLL